MLKKKKFPQKWREWTKSCISTVQYFILINGKPCGKIKPKRGIIQGDLISPFIFVLAIDYLNCLLKHLEILNKIKGVIIKDINLTHLLFADDILFFVQDDDENIRNLQFTIHLFESASDLNINLTKTSVSSVNANKERTDKLANSWGINTLFFSYLLLRDASWWQAKNKLFLGQHHWQDSQKTKQLDGGRLTMINSSLVSLPTCQLSVFKTLKSCCKKIEKHWRNFLWKDNFENVCLKNTEKRTLNPISWKIATLTKEKGDLSITSVESTNFALLKKWL